VLEDWNKANEANPNYRLVDTGREEFRAVFSILSGIARKEKNKDLALRLMEEAVGNKGITDILSNLPIGIRRQYLRWFQNKQNLTDIWIAWNQDTAEARE